jgi:outer membrane protein assembly factor BamD
MISKVNTFLVIAVLGLAVACGGKSGGGSVEYSVSAQKNYEKGLKELEDKDWVAASKYFGFIKSRFPYSKYAVLAELRLADAEFGAEQYLEAIDSYTEKKSVVLAS